MTRPLLFPALLIFASTCVLNAAQSGAPASDQTGAHTIAIEGSSTVYPITVAVAEKIAQQNPQLTSEVACTGSTAGLRRLIAGEIPIANSSRPIRADELAKATKNGVELIELPIAFDGVTVAINKRNTFVDKLTVEELRLLWKPDSTIKNWSQIRAGWPNKPIALFGQGRDSGTFDFFTEAIVGEARAIRSEFTGSEDDDVLVRGIVSNEYALGYFGYAYFKENETMLRAVPIDNGQGPVTPAMDTILNGTYRPLSRPLFLYVNKTECVRPEISAFIESYLRLVPQIVPQIGYVELGERVDALVRARWNARLSGSLFVGAKPGIKIDDVLSRSLGSLAPAAPATASKSPAVTGVATAAATVAAVSATKAATETKSTVDKNNNDKNKYDNNSVDKNTALEKSASEKTSMNKNSQMSVLPAVTVTAASATPVAVASAPPAAATSNAWVAVAASTPARATSPASPTSDGDAWQAPHNDEFRMLITRMRDQSLLVARQSLDDATTIPDLDHSVQELRARVQAMTIAFRGAPHAGTLSIGEAAALAENGQNTEAAYAELLARVTLTEAGRGVMNDEALASFRQAAIELSDRSLRRSLVIALRNPCAANLPYFTEAVSGFSKDKADLAIILCYARGGFALR